MGACSTTQRIPDAGGWLVRSCYPPRISRLSADKSRPVRVCGVAHCAQQARTVTFQLTYPRRYLVALPADMDDMKNPRRQVGDEPLRCRGVHHEEAGVPRAGIAILEGTSP